MAGRRGPLLVLLWCAGCTATHQIGVVDGGGVDGGCRSDEDCPCGEFCFADGSVSPTCAEGDDEACAGDPDCTDDQAEQPGTICAELVRDGGACAVGACVRLFGDAGSCRTDDDCDCLSLCVWLDGGPPTCARYLDDGCPAGCGTCVAPIRTRSSCGPACMPGEDGG
jgi:hypothetical protein